MGRPHSLKSWREAQGLTQQQVANGIGIHVQYVSQIERGARRPGMQVALKIRDYTKGAVTLDALAPSQRAA